MYVNSACYLFFVLILALLKKADSMSFQVKPSTMASVVKGLYDLQPGENVCPSFSVFSV